MTKLGVAILVHELDYPGGMERRAGALAAELARLGRKVVVISSMEIARPSDLLRWRPFERRHGFLIHWIPFLPGVSTATRHELYETLAAWILGLTPSIGTIYGFQGQTGGVHAAKLAPVLGVATVASLACSGAVGDLCTIQRRPDARATLELLGRLDRIVHLNDESRDEALAANLAPPLLVHIPSGIDTERFAQASPAALLELGPAEERELVVFVGRLSSDRQKRVDVLIEAFARVLTRRPRARLVVVGDGSARPVLEALARSLGVEGAVLFTGVRDDVPSLLKAAHAFVLPSAQEGMSIALLEALAAGAPVVASDISGNRALVAHDREALLVPVDDIGALEHAIVRILEDRALSSRLAAAGLKKAEEHSLENMALHCLDVFDSLPREAPGGPGRFVARYLGSELTGLPWMFLRGVLRTPGWLWAKVGGL